MRTLTAYRWEMLLVVLTAAAAAWATVLSPYYLGFDQITYSLQQSMAVPAVIAAGLMIIVVIGEIDISLPAILALGNILFAHFSQIGVPVWLAGLAVVAVAVGAGVLNGALVVAFGLPSLAVTLGMMGAYRAFALLIGGQEGYAAFDESYIWLGSALIGDVMPASLVLVAIVFAVFTFVMHGTVYGRLCYVIGNNARTARLSGVRVPLIKIAAFAIGGATAALASLVYVGQYQSARADNASDILLFIVSAVVLGGVDIFGGRGNVVGVLLALLLLGTLKNGMGLANFPGPVQTLVVGTLLVVAVLIPRLAELNRARLSPGRRQPAPEPRGQPP
jgi:rhamnose transport system permease protein